MKNTFLISLLKPISPISICEITTHTDDLGREVKIYHRIIDACPNAQTDISTNVTVIEQVTYKNRKVHLSKEGRNYLYEYLKTEA